MSRFRKLASVEVGISGSDFVSECELSVRVFGIGRYLLTLPRYMEYKKLQISATLLVLTLFLGTCGYYLFEEMSLFEGLYMTVITISTVGFSEIKPLTVHGRVITLLIRDRSLQLSQTPTMCLSPLRQKGCVLIYLFYPAPRMKKMKPSFCAPVLRASYALT
jgi:hypothetical protein